ncbi:MAG: GNAT family N-acetyltransferase, partial [Terriglobia bacterium]
EFSLWYRQPFGYAAAMIVTTDRLILRDFVESDLRRITEYRLDERYRRYYPEDKSTDGNSLRFVHLVMGWSSETPRRKFQLAILRASDNLLIGNCGIRTTSEQDMEAEFGCELDPRFWQQGYATEAGKAMLEQAFGFLGMHRVWSRTIAENHSAAKVAQRLGMRLEGCLRQSTFMNGRWWDNHLYAILEQEWRKGY